MHLQFFFQFPVCFLASFTFTSMVDTAVFDTSVKD